MKASSKNWRNVRIAFILLFLLEHTVFFILTIHDNNLLHFSIYITFALLGIILAFLGHILSAAKFVIISVLSGAVIFSLVSLFSIYSLIQFQYRQLAQQNINLSSLFCEDMCGKIYYDNIFLLIILPLSIVSLIPIIIKEIAVRKNIERL